MLNSPAAFPWQWQNRFYPDPLSFALTGIFQMEPPETHSQVPIAQYHDSDIRDQVFLASFWVVRMRSKSRFSEKMLRRKIANPTIIVNSGR